MKQGFFVTGTDTGVGKTLISSALVHHFAISGYSAVGLKPVAAGCAWSDGRLLSEDVVQLRAASNVVLPLEVTNPYAFEPPLAPHVAAEMAGQSIEMAPILQAFAQAAAVADAVVVEGVGGFRVPLNAQEDTADLAAELGLPVILVVGMRLGCLSHALLTVESIKARNLKLAGWIANTIDPQMTAFKENLQSLEKRIPATCLGVVSYQQQPDFVAVESVLRQQKLGDIVCAQLPKMAKMP
jgi:dethiobiotin synthetase